MTAAPGSPPPLSKSWPQNDLVPAEWTVSQAANWAWAWLQWRRNEDGLAVQLPGNWKRWIGIVKNLRNDMGPEGFCDYVGFVANEWPRIRAAMGRIGETMPIGETTLAHGMVREKVLFLRDNPGWRPQPNTLTASTPRNAQTTNVNPQYRGVF